ncbi:gamma carbonic anhydrase family protein [Halorubrum sp. DTA98]|uniref:gamma carbonic anhydrase family protein n=1 Tax=Halorubrum sp. DTA98 TaxID=3402163 RepID=UPI003AAD6990
MFKSFDGNTPDVSAEAYVADLTYLAGDVSVERGASVWPFVCLRGDHGPVSIGEETNVQEFTTVHGASLGDRVSVGHGAVVDFATVEDDCLIGMQSSVLRGATVESGCIVAANAVVLGEQTIPEGHLAYGTPAETRPLTDDQIAEIDRVREHYVELGRRFADDH